MLKRSLKRSDVDYFTNWDLSGAEKRVIMIKIQFCQNINHFLFQHMKQHDMRVVGTNMGILVSWYQWKLLRIGTGKHVETKHKILGDEISEKGLKSQLFTAVTL